MPGTKSRYAETQSLYVELLSKPIGLASWSRGLDWDDELKYFSFHPGLKYTRS